jgi:protein involved in polysaccharide export with SLBB domain
MVSLRLPFLLAALCAAATAAETPTVEPVAMPEPAPATEPLPTTVPAEPPAASLPTDPLPAVAPAETLPPTAPAEPPPPIDTGYHLFPGDLVQIAVFDEPDLSLTQPATVDTAPFPLIGQLSPLAGRSTAAVQDEIRRRLLDGFLRQPVVTVTVASYARREAWVVGAVQRPGPILLDPLRPLTANQAIGAAGGLTEDADRAAARILRDLPLLPGAKSILFLPDVALPTQDPVLVHGDLIVVPRAARIFVLGQVAHPGALPMPASELLTVSRAVTMAGGFDRFAKEGAVNLLRLGEPVRSLDVRAVLEGDPEAEDPTLKAGDTIFVPESRF